MLEVRSLLLSGLLIAFTACNTNTSQISTNLTLCCPGDYHSYARYGLTTSNIPVFLEDYLVAEFDAAFREKGVARNDEDNDVRVTLTYNHVNLRSDQEDVDPFMRIENMTTELNYVAVIDILISETGTGIDVWRGTISRIHQVVPGEYMHEESARLQFRQAFRDVLASYPPLSS